MKIYVFAKVFTLFFLFGVYLLFTWMFLGAWMNGGWIVVVVDRFGEGLAELVFLVAVLPAVSYVVSRETLHSVRSVFSKKRICM